MTHKEAASKKATDILTKIAERDAAPQAHQPKTRKLYQVSLGNGRLTSRLYAYNRARKIAARYNRLTGTTDAYAAGPLRVNV